MRDEEALKELILKYADSKDLKFITLKALDILNNNIDSIMLESF